MSFLYETGRKEAYSVAPIKCIRFAKVSQRFPMLFKHLLEISRDFYSARTDSVYQIPLQLMEKRVLGTGSSPM